MANLPDPRLPCKHPEPGPLPSPGVDRFHGYCGPLRLPLSPDPYRRLDVASAHDSGSPVLRRHPSQRAVSTTPVDRSTLMVVVGRTRRPSPCLGRVGIHDRLSGPAPSSRVLRPVALQLDLLELLSGGFSRGDYSPHLLRSYRGVPSIPQAGLAPAGLTAPFTAPLNKYVGSSSAAPYSPMR